MHLAGSAPSIGPAHTPWDHPSHTTLGERDGEAPSNPQDLEGPTCQGQRSPEGSPGSGAEKPPRRQAAAGPTERAAARGERGGPDPQVQASWAGWQAHGAAPCSCEGEVSPATLPGPMGAAPWAGVPRRGKWGLSVKTAEFTAHKEPAGGQHMGWTLF